MVKLIKLKIRENLSIKEKMALMKLKYDILEDLKKRLYRQYSENTAKTYYNAIKNALKNQQFGSIKEIDINKVLEHCKGLKVKSRVSAVKQGLLGFKGMDENFRIDEYEFDEIIKKKRNRRVKNFQMLNLSTTLRRINKIENMKLKIAYRLMLATGLRVEEASNLKKNDIKVEGNRLIVSVIDGKGDKSRVVESLPDKYLAEKISEMSALVKDNERLFYKDDYMIRIACKNNFKCHDLRRAHAQIIYNGIDDSKKAVEAVQQQLGHSEYNTIYKKYLSRKIDFSGTKYKNGGFKVGILG